MAKKSASKKKVTKKEAVVETPVDSDQEPEAPPAIVKEPLYKTVDSGVKGKGKRKPSVTVQAKSEFDKQHGKK